MSLFKTISIFDQKESQVMDLAFWGYISQKTVWYRKLFYY